MMKTRAIYVLIVIGAISIWLGSTLPDSFFDYNFDKFFKPDEAATQYFENHKDVFGTDNDFVIIGLVSHSGAFDPGFLQKVESLTSDLGEIPFVENVTSPTNISYPVREPLTGALFKRPLLSGNREKDSLRVFSDPSLISNIFSRDTAAVSIVLATKSELSKNKSDTLATALNAVLAKYEFDGIHLAGRSLGQVVYIKKIQNEFALFMGISLIFIIGLLYAVFRSFRGVLIPLCTVLLAVVWSIGILNLSGRGISLLLTMLPPVIFVVGMSDAVHLYARYLEELRRGLDKMAALKEMVFDTGLATLLTSITTAIGFASLYFTGIPALQEFGLLTAAGVLAAFVICITLMPAWLVLSPIPSKTLAHSKNSIWERLLQKSFLPIVRHRRKIYLISGILAVIFIGFTSQLGMNNFLLEDLRPGEKLRKDFTFFDDYFSGVRPFEIGFKIKNDETDILTPENLVQIEKLEVYLENFYGAKALTSPITFVKEINRSGNAGRNAFYRLPTDAVAWRSNIRDMERIRKTGKMDIVLDESGRYGRIFGRVGDWGAQEFERKNSELMAFIADENLDANFDIEITGTGTLIDRTNQNIALSLAKGLGVAILLIAVIMGMMFRSFSMVIYALIPNLLPLLAVSAIMSATGIDLKMSTSIIFTIAFGIAVDDTIHLLSRFRLELSKGFSKKESMKNAFVHTGKAMILTSLIIFGGFISLCFSTFQSTFFIGLFVTLTLIFALVFDLTLLPALVVSESDSDVASGNGFAEKAHNTNEQSNTDRITQIPGNR